MNREIIAELHYDGTVVMAANLSFIRAGGEELPGQDDVLQVSERLVTACCYDFIATAQEHQRKLRLDSTLQLTSLIISPDKTQGHGTAHLDLGRWGGDGAAVRPQAPPSPACSHRAFPSAADDEGRCSADELRADLMSQFGL
ncbi:hypothetical protein STENM327S_05940 [Streptomyces tendae]